MGNNLALTETQARQLANLLFNNLRGLIEAETGAQVNSNSSYARLSIEEETVVGGKSESYIKIYITDVEESYMENSAQIHLSFRIYFRLLSEGQNNGI